MLRIGGSLGAVNVDGPERYPLECEPRLSFALSGYICGVDVEWCIDGQTVGVKADTLSKGGPPEAIILGDIEEVIPSCQSLGPLAEFVEAFLEFRFCEPAVESMAIE